MNVELFKVQGVEFLLVPNPKNREEGTLYSRAGKEKEDAVIIPGMGRWTEEGFGDIKFMKNVHAPAVAKTIKETP